jgi:hypothetical protein
MLAERVALASAFAASWPGSSGRSEHGYGECDDEDGKAHGREAKCFHALS